MLKRILLLLSFAIVLTVGGVLLQTSTALAQVDTGLADVGNTVVLTDTDPRTIAANIINIALGLLGVILVVIIVYAGFLYMTSGGDPAKTEKALAYIKNAVIGLIIILAAWGITKFVIEGLLSATGPGGGGTTAPGSGGSGGAGGGGFGSGGSTRPFEIQSITPAGSVNTRKVVVKIVFSQAVSAESAAEEGNVTVVGPNGTVVPGQVTVENRVVTFTPNTPCPAPNEDRRCYDADTEYTVRVANGLESAAGPTLSCGGFSPSCEQAFRTGSAVEVTPPEVTLTNPVAGQSVPADALVDVNAFVRDETGVSYVQFRAGADVIGEATPEAGTNSPSTFDARVQWDTAGLAPGSAQTLVATAYDIDSGVASTAPVNVVIRAASCFDGTQNGEETGLDCGGNPASTNYCGACPGSACQASTDCAGNACTNGQCVEQPVITSITPMDGAVGTFVTIQGVSFGSRGTVRFVGAAGSPGVVATVPQACASVGDGWTPTSLVVQVPPGAQSGAIEVTNGVSGLSDSTNSPPNPFITDFLVNDVQRPGICALTPTSGAPGAELTITGSGFGNAPASLVFGDRLLSSTRWTNDQITALVPNVMTGPYPVQVQLAADRMSNPVAFTVTPPGNTTDNAPELLLVTPDRGPVQTYVTLTGRNFGSTVGQVFFRDSATGNEALADTNFPPMCAGGFWSNDMIVVKVPRAFTQGSTSGLESGAYTVRVVASRAGSPESNAVAFTVNTEPLTPGICAVQPRVAPIGTPVTLYGEGFTEGPGAVTFFQDRLGDAEKWSSTEIRAAVPAGTRSGPVTVTPASSQRTSNGVLLEVRRCTEAPDVCQGGEVCCADGTCRAAGSCSAAADRAMFAWRVSTGLIPRAPRVVEECRAGEVPSPSPWLSRSGGDSACVNTAISIRFTTLLEPTSVNANSFTLFACTGQGNNPCDQTAPVLLASGSPELANANATQDYVTLTPAQPLTPSTRYRVVLSTAVRGFGDAGATMAEDASRCGAGNAYCFDFQTRGDTTPCTLGGITVTPDPYTAAKQGPLPVTHRATPIAAGDACTFLACDSFEWEWSTTDGRASVTNVSGACRQTVTAQAETGDVPVGILADAAGVRGSADLYIRFVPPEVTRFGPNCDEACLNAAIWATFTSEIDPTTANPSNVSVQRCANENCLDLDPPFALAPNTVRLTTVPGSADDRLRQLVVDPLTLVGGVPTPFLVKGQFYKVTVKGGETGIRSVDGVPLAGMNTADGFSWTFRVRQGDAAMCAVDRIDVAPLEKYENRVGATQAFVATPHTVPDSCSQEGQPLAFTDGFSWASSDMSVATLWDNGMIDTGPVPVGCTNQCLLMGAAGVAGKTAQCGNGIVETTNAPYCVNGRTVPWQQACVVLAAGGTGGEECDDGNDDGNDACGNTCLWNPVASVVQGGTCGDAILDVGEDCDFGRVCQGPLNENAVMKEGSSCTTNEDAAQCVADGGTCVVPMMRGCSPTCRNLGSGPGGSTCGNGDLADGEDCDDGNRANGDGCSAACLNEGSSRTIYAACGNKTLEPGEACERNPDDSWPAGCDARTCLRTGTAVCPVNAQDPTGCCGNFQVEAGEDCDFGDTTSGDGCSAQCLFEGSSLAYDAPSFCGNGVQETGEQCEAPAGDGRVDPLQVAVIVGEGTPDANGRMSSTISAALPSQSQAGQATYGLQCGYVDEVSCSPLRDGYDEMQGLTTAGCCSDRPTLASYYPINASTDVCRNVRISGVFPMPMDEGSMRANFTLAKRIQAAECPDGLTDITDAREVMPRGFRGFVVRLWERFTALFRADAALAQKWCAGTVTGTLTTQATEAGTEFFFTLDVALEPRTEYRVRFQGDTSTYAEGSSENPLSDNKNVDKRWGVKSKNGVVAMPDTADAGRLSWTFTTGERLCTVDRVTVRDTNESSPNFFTATNETHVFVASAESLQNGRPVFVSPIPGVYDWAWDNWAFSRPNVLDIRPAALTDAEKLLSATTRDVVAKGESGTGFLTARVRITADTVNPVSTVDQVTEGTETLTASLCNNPWPSRTDAPFRDAEGSPSLVGTPFQDATLFFNFSMTYCRDAGVPGQNEDVPALVPSVARPDQVDRDQGVLRQYLFTFREPALAQDAIGMRVAANPLHLSPLEWYRSKGFNGNPQPLTVDGYEAVRDGRTVYVGAASTEGPGTPIYSNIYILSYNENAQAMTRQIYDALLASLSFNDNVSAGVSNACETAAGLLVPGEGGAPIACSQDAECNRFGAGARCANFKGKLQRDLVRLGNMRTMANALTDARNAQGSYPVLRTGSFLSGFTTSRWPSWNDALRTAMGAGSLPVDPVNAFVACGRCTNGGTVCSADADCGAGGVCAAQDGFDPATCWNAQNEQFLCANDEQGSQMYAYQSLGGGSGYELSAALEVPPPNPLDLSDRWWTPAPVVSANGGTFTYTGICQGERMATRGVCGDGVVNEGEMCELTGPTATRQAQCTVNGNPDGERQERCVACTAYAPDPGQPGCFARTACGNGRVDTGEVCDDGTENGRYGRCDAFCNGYAAYCGDGQLSPGEVCDLGAENRDYCPPRGCSPTTSCNLTCSGAPAYCGNRRVDAGEQCDGTAIATPLAICSAGTKLNEPCRTNADCGAGGVCGGTNETKACDSGDVRVRDCLLCTYSPWRACDRQGMCGDGQLNGTEQCDDGNKVNEDGCTNTCQANVCGDGFRFAGVEECDLAGNNGKPCNTAEYGSTCTACSLSCKFQLTQGGFCGDNVLTAASGEQCDGPALGSPVPSCSALGFDYLKESALQCTPGCQYTGCGYCGDTPGNGSVAGVAFDTLFQKPVANARASLYYRGALQQQTQTDINGYFQFNSLDTRQECTQYRLVVDSYLDNPLTPLDEGLRGGYRPVTVQAFKPTNADLIAAVESAALGVEVENPNGSGTVAQINLLPQLANDEYVVQLWWDPRGGYDGMQRAFQESLADDPTGRAFYNESSMEMHDLVVRTPYLYTPGSNASCSLSETPQVYKGVGRNSDALLTDFDSVPGITGVDRTNAYTGMASCTNKVRATSTYTCEGESVPQNLKGKIGCIASMECRFRFGFAGADCTGVAEPSRSGNPSVLSGSTGAYLFCYHPEWIGTDYEDTYANDASCTNFILPPQSVFIRASSGQYDVLVSKYRLFGNGSHRTTRSFIREWLAERNAELRIYDEDGLRDTVKFNDNWVPQSSEPVGRWAAYDNQLGKVCWADGSVDADTPEQTVRTMVERLDAVTASPVWTPFSIDAGGDKILSWGGGNAGADYLYFSDLSHGIARAMYAGGSGDPAYACYEESCQSEQGYWPCSCEDCEGVEGGR